MGPIVKLPLSVSNLYSELVQQVIAAEARRNIGDLKGTFVKKEIKGKIYWYLQHSEGGKLRQAYLGPNTPELLEQIEKKKRNKGEKKNDEENRKNLCRMFVKGGGSLVDPVSSKILALLSRSGVTKMGGVLVGSHAFVCYANMLGIRWPSSTKTNDIDIAQDESVSIALSEEENQIDLPNILEKAAMGFLPIPQLNHKHPSTSFKIRGQETHIDFLTPLLGPEKEKPVFLPFLKIAALPLRFLDYLIEEPIPAVLPYDEGILVTVPQLARFAFHKLLVSRKRGSAFHTKAEKDREQAKLLLKVLIEEQPAEIQSAWKALKKRGAGWSQPVYEGMRQLNKKDPMLFQELSRLLRIT